MINRRTFLTGSAAAITAPYVLRANAGGGLAPRIRRDVQSLSYSDPFFAKYAQAVRAMHQLPGNDPRNWRNQALIHINRCRHGASDFLHWHRWYIHYFEKICGELIGDHSFTLAYWNWSAAGGVIPAPFFDRKALNVAFWNDPSDAQSPSWSPNPVRTVGVRGMVKGQRLQDDPNVGQSFTQGAIDGIKQQRNFAVFENQLETSPHNNAHNLVGGAGGHMSDGMSPLDPIFWLHHCNVDRLWAEWQAAGNASPGLSSNYDNQFFGKRGRPRPASSAGALDFLALGYTYDTIGARLATLRSAQGPAPDPQIIASDSTQKIAMTDSETNYSIPATNLINHLSQRSAGNHVLARLRLIPPAQATPLLCKVFINCPNLRPTTATTDKHYAGSFSLFGPNSAHLERSYIIDITKTLLSLASEGGVKLQNIKLQLMPTYGDGKPASVIFEVKGVEILES